MVTRVPGYPVSSGTRVPGFGSASTAPHPVGYTVPNFEAERCLSATTMASQAGCEIRKSEVRGSILAFIIPRKKENKKRGGYLMFKNAT